MIRVSLRRSLFEDPLGAPIEMACGPDGVFVRDLVPEEALEAAEVFIDRRRAEDLDERVPDEAWVDVVMRPGAPTLGSIVISLVVSAAVTFVFSLLFPPPAPPKRRDDEESPTYGFSGISTSRAIGLPIPIGFGEMRTGGQIIAEFVRTVGLPPVTDYYFLVSLGEGPIHSIGGVTADNPPESPLRSDDPDHPLPSGVQVNGNSLENLSDVELHVRLGSNEQLPIPGFEEVKTQFTVGVTLGQVTVGGVDNSGAILTDPTGTADDAIWAEWGEAFDISGQEADSFIVVLRWPQGLYQINSQTGDLTPQRTRIAIRYIELDAFGVPITSGGPNNDGYVRLPVEPDIVFTQQGQFEYEIRHDFLDPQSFTNPTIGKCLTSGGSISDRAELDTSTATLPVAWQAGAEFAEITVEGWVYIDGLSDRMPVWSWGTPEGGTGQGILLRIEKGNYVVQGMPTTLYRPNALVGAGGGYQRVFPLSGIWIGPLDGLSAGQWVHLAWTYKAGGAANDRVRIYVNGNLWVDEEGQYNARVPGGQNWKLLADAANGFFGRLDEINVYERELTSGEILQRYNSGAGKYGSSLPNLVAGYHFDTFTPGTPSTTPDYSGLTGDLELLGAATAGVTDGIVIADPGGTRKRGRYRVEVLRANPDSTNSRQQDDVEWADLIAVLDEQFSYPNTALVGGRIRASEQLNTTAPNLTFLAKFHLCPIWDGVSEASPNFTYAWTRNPAWVLLKIILDKRWGLGQWYEATDVDLPSFLDFAQHCNEIVYDGKHRLESANGEVTDVQYDSTTTDPSTGATRGSLKLIFDPSVSLPTHWIPGSWVRLDGFPTPNDDPDIALDINNGTDPQDTGGYEIKSRDISLGAVALTVYWDRLPEGDPWTSGALLSTKIAPQTLVNDYQAVVEGGERRHELDVFMDTERKGWDWLVELAGSARATPIKIGSRIRIIYSAPRPLSGLISSRDIVPNSLRMSWEGPKRRFNVVTIGFLDRDRNYERDEVGPVEHSSIQNAGSFEDYRTHSFFMVGATRRSQVHRHALFMLNAQQLLVRRGSVTLLPGAVPYLPGDRVRIAHDLLPRGVSGGAMADSASNTSLVIDREVTLEAGKTYKLAVRNPADGTVEVQTVSSPAASYSPGDTITVASAFGFAPTRGAAYVLAEDGAELEVEIGRVKVNEDLSVEVEFVEYQPSIYDDRVPPLQAGTSEPLTQPAVGDGTIPDDPVRIRGQITTGFTPGGAVRQRLALGWKHPERTAGVVRSSRILLSINDGPLELVAEVPGREESARVELPPLAPGDTVSAFVQPLGVGGVRRRAELLPELRLGYQPGFGAPEPPTNVSVDFVGDQAVYRWRLPEGAPWLSVEARRGSWDLGQPIFLSAPGDLEHGPTRNWAPGRLEVRTRDPLGQLSRPVVLELAPDVQRDQTVLEVSYQTQEWRDFGDGWTLDSPGGAPNTSLSGLARRADGDLEFSGSALTGTLTTVDPIAARSGTDPLDPRPVYVSATAVARRLWPLAPQDAPWAPGDPRTARMSPQGPNRLLEGESPGVTLTLEVRVNTDGTSAGWGGWRPYRPGLLEAVAVQFRLTVTRDDTTYGVRISSLATEVAAKPASLYDTTPEQAYLWRELAP